MRSVAGCAGGQLAASQSGVEDILCKLFTVYSSFAQPRVTIARTAHLLFTFNIFGFPRGNLCEQ
jgi:hypothetical protein